MSGGLSMKYSGIGGQAVLEGVMMRNKDQYAVAVRKSDGDIVIKKDKCGSLTQKSAFFRAPFIRGVFNFIDSLTLGMSSLNFSSSFFAEEEDEKSKAKTEAQKKREDAIMNVITIIISVVLAVGIFLVGPWLIADRVLGSIINNKYLVVLIEGVMRVILFIAYIALIQLMPDIKRLFMYHGSEHKCINCIEHGMELTVENVRKSSRFHKRCGTSFLLIVMIISILVLMLVQFDSRWLRLLMRILLIPVIAGISYEFLRAAGTHDNPVMNFLSQPGLALQRLTTKEPEDDMIEVGIASVEAVFDWKGYLTENFNMHYEDAQAGEDADDAE